MSRRPAMIPALALLLQAPGLSRDELEHRRSHLIRRLVKHAYETVPFYRRHFDSANIDPSSIQSTENLARIPVVERGDLRSRPPRDVIARGIDPDSLVSRRTSGTSGQPFRTYRTWLEQNLAHLYRIRAQRSVGVRGRDRIVTVAGPNSVHSRDNKLIGQTMARLGFRPRTVIDMYLDPAAILAGIEALHPQCITGYPGVLARVADLARERPSFPSPRIVVCGAERLTPPLRRRIESGFNTTVRDFYGCHECNLVAWECPESGLLHTSDDSVVVEVIRDGRPAAEGETGEVVITSLHHYAMPFVRYQLGDLAVRGPESCPCGSPFRTLARIDGRVFDDFILNGRRVQAQELGVTLAKVCPWIAQYQITQERLDRVVVRVSPERDDSVPELDGARAVIADAVGPGIEIEVIVTRDFPVEPNGKMRVIRSMVTAPRENEAG